MTTKEDLRNFLRAQKIARDVYAKKDTEYGSAWKRSAATWGPSFIAMRLQEDVSKLVALTKAKKVDRDALVNALVDIQVYATFGLMHARFGAGARRY